MERLAPVGKLVFIQVRGDGVSDVREDKFLKALHGYQGQGDRLIVIQAFDSSFFGAQR